MRPEQGAFAPPGECRSARTGWRYWGAGKSRQGRQFVAGINGAAHKHDTPPRGPARARLVHFRNVRGLSVYIFSNSGTSQLRPRIARTQSGETRLSG